MAKETKKIAGFNDARGNLVVIGSRVAYNYSGDVAIGTVANITPANVKIERDPEWTSTGRMIYKDGEWILEEIANVKPEYSNVKNRRGILVIYEGKSGLLQKEVDFRNWYQSKVDDAQAKLDAKEQKINERTTDLIKTVVNGGDIDEVKDKLIELFGEDVLKHQEDVPKWAKEILGY